MIYKLNNKEYETKEVNFREMLKMEKCGVDITTLGKANTFNQIACMVSYITGLTKEKAINEIEAHLDNGGTFEDVINCFDFLTESDFFKKVGANK